MIKARLLEEAGYNSSILGFGMAMKPRSADVTKWWDEARCERVTKTAEVNAGRGMGHDKFLRGIMTWWLLDLPRFFSQEHATYKVGTVTMSASTMHRITYEPVTLDSFDTTDLNDDDEWALQLLLDQINNAVNKKELKRAKKMLPESYMLEQVWVASYAVLNCIIQQRHNHRLEGWQELIAAFREQVEHPELLVDQLAKKCKGDCKCQSSK